MSEFKDLHKFFGQHQPPPLPPQPPPPQLPQPPPQHPQHHQRGAANHGSFTGAGSNSLTNFFPESEPFPDNDFRSFSDLLAGALATPLPGTGELNLGLDNYNWGADHRAEKSNRNNNNNGNNNSNNNGNNNDANNNDVNANNGVGFKQNRPGSLVLPPVAPVFNVSPGFSPSAFLTSPTFLSPLGMSPQQTLAHITAQAAHSALSHQAHLTNIQPADTPNNNNTNNPPSFPSTTTAAPPPYQPPIFNTGHHQHGRAPQHSFPAAVDKPTDDGYNWRKYGQKQVKGSEYPRSYYRCTTPNCPVKKKVERSYDGHITEIIYKGQHNHGRPQNGRRGNKDTNNTGCLLGGDSLWPGGANNNNNNNVQYDSAQATSMQLNGPSDSEESAENSQHLLGDGDGDGDGDDDDDDDDDYNDQPRAKRRKGGGGVREGGYTHRTMTEPKIVVQTRSDVDLLDDGYRWRKYGQKVVKGNPNPRSYYKCTTAGCKVRKHVERASTDASAVITTYEGKHNHDVPATRGSSSNNNNNNNNNFQPTQMKLHNNSAVAQMSFGNNNNNNDQRPMTLRLKEEQLVL